jgi:hypothetical protein
MCSVGLFCDSDRIKEEVALATVPCHMFQLPPASAKRIADSIRRELAGSLRVLGERELRCRVVNHLSPSLWKLLDGVNFGRIRLELTSVPDYAALFSLMWNLCTPSIRDSLTRRERAFLVYVAEEAQGLWLCPEHPFAVNFHCAPNLHCASLCYPETLVDFVLARLDACCDRSP